MVAINSKDAPVSNQHTYPLGALEYTLLGIGFIFAVFFWANTGFGFYRPYKGSFFIKSIPTVVLAILVYRHRTSLSEFYLFCAILLQSVGDVIIDFDRTANVIPAMLFTAMAHTMYNATFLRDRKVLSIVPSAKKVLALFLGLYGLLFGAFLIYNVALKQEWLMLPLIGVYIVLLTGVAVNALLANFRGSWIALGAVFYIITDSVLGYHLYVSPIHGNHFWTWPMYYSGQLLITLNYIREKA